MTHSSLSHPNHPIWWVKGQGREGGQRTYMLTINGTEGTAGMWHSSDMSVSYIVLLRKLKKRIKPILQWEQIHWNSYTRMHLTGWIWMFMTVFWAWILCNSTINPRDRRIVSLLTEGWWQFLQRCVPRYACVKRSHLFYFHWFSEWNKATCAGKRNWSIKNPIWFSFSKCSHLVVHEGQRFTYMHNKRKPHME